MFKYDKDHVSINMIAAHGFFFKFVWRFILVNVVISLFPIDGLVTLILNIPATNSVVWSSLVSLLTGYMATTISIWAIRNAEFKNKKFGEKTTTKLVVKNNNEIISATYIAWCKASLSYYWRSVFFVTALIVLGTLVLGNLGRVEITILGLTGFYLGWLWFSLFNETKFLYFDFVETINRDK